MGLISQTIQASIKNCKNKARIGKFGKSSDGIILIAAQCRGSGIARDMCQLRNLNIFPIRSADGRKSRFVTFRMRHWRDLQHQLSAVPKVDFENRWILRGERTRVGTAA